MSIPSSYNPELQSLVSRLPKSLSQHLHRAGRMADKLAELHRVDRSKASVAAFAHDIVRNVPGSELLALAQSFGLEIHPVEQQNQVLLHGPVGAELVRTQCGINDPEILESIRWHSTFNRGLSSVSKVVFLADKLDRNKASRYPDLSIKRKLAQQDMDSAILSFLEDDLLRMMRNQETIHPASLEGRNWLLKSGT